MREMFVLHIVGQVGSRTMLRAPHARLRMFTRSRNDKLVRPADRISATPATGHRPSKADDANGATTACFRCGSDHWPASAFRTAHRSTFFSCGSSSMEASPVARSFIQQRQPCEDQERADGDVGERHGVNLRANATRQRPIGPGARVQRRPTTWDDIACSIDRARSRQ